MKKKASVNLVAALAAAAVTLGVGVLLSSCDSGGGDGPSGNSTVQGNVSSFTTGTALFRPAPKARGLERLLAGVGDLLVPGAKASGMSGVGVRIVGTDLQTTTDDGYFVMSGVPAGECQMQFSFNGTNAYMTFDVPANSTVTLDNVTCRGGTATAGHMNVQMMGNDHDGGMPMNSNMNTSGHMGVTVYSP